MGLDHALRPFLQDPEVHQSNFPLPEDQRENAPRPLENISTTDRSQLDESQISSRLTKRSLRLRELGSGGTSPVVLQAHAKTGAA
jgi:hypothetical protein